MKKAMLLLCVVWMIAGAQEVKADKALTVQTVELGLFQPRNGKGVANQNNRQTVRKTKKYWSKNAKSLKRK